MPATLLATDRFGHPIQALKAGLVAMVTASVGGTNKMTAALSADTVCIRLISTAHCYVSIGEINTVEASAGSMYLPANVPEYFRIDQATSVAVAVMGVGAGSLYVTQMT